MDAGLKALQQIIQEMKTLLAWHKLRLGEARQMSVSGIRFSDTTRTDLLDKYSAFQSISIQMHGVLDDENIKLNKGRLKSIKSKLMTMEYQVHYLGSGVSFF